MKSKVIIENGKTTIVLTPENEFEIGVINKVVEKEISFKIDTSFKSEYNPNHFNRKINHRIEMLIEEKEQ